MVRNDCFIDKILDSDDADRRALPMFERQRSLRIGRGRKGHSGKRHRQRDAGSHDDVATVDRDWSV